jgi:hypothetical protein
MKLAEFFTRSHAVILIMVGRASLPEVPLKHMEIAMAWEKTQAAIDQLQASIARATADKASDQQTITGLQSDNASLTQQLADADDQIATMLQPAVDAGNQLAPEPAPEPAPTPAADPSADQAAQA